MAQKTVLVVEDEPAVRAMLSLVLETRDYRVVVAGDGQQALVKVQTERPDAILLDLMLPKIDGFSVIEALYGDARSARTPIIVMSAIHRLESMDDLGVRAFLSKPFDIDGLLGALEEALASAPPTDAPQLREHGVAPPPPKDSSVLLGPPYNAGPLLH